MPRVDVPVQELNTMAGEAMVAGTAADATNDHEFTNDGRTVLYVENTGAGAVAVTIPMVADTFGRSGSKGPTTVPATTGRTVFGPFDPTVFNQSTGKVNVDIDVSAGVTLRAWKIAEKGA